VHATLADEEVLGDDEVIVLRRGHGSGQQTVSAPPQPNGAVCADRV
jgi:hypothetical protein